MEATEIHGKTSYFQNENPYCTPRKIALITSIVLLIISIAVAAHFDFGSTGSFIGIGGAAISLTTMVGLALSSVTCCKKEEIEIEKKTISSKEEIVIEKKVISSLDALNTTQLIKPEVRPWVRARNSSAFTSIEGLANYYQRLPKSPLTPSSDFNQNVDPLNRVNYCILTQLLDSIFLYCGLKILKHAPTREKISQLLFYLDNPKRQSLKFLISKDSCKNELQSLLFIFFNKFIDGCSQKDLNPFRKELMGDLNKCYASDFYKGSEKAYFLLNKETALEQFPEIAFLQMIGFELTVQGSLNRFFWETGEFLKNRSSSGMENVSFTFEDNLSFPIWRNKFKSASGDFGSTFLHYGALHNPSALKLFLDACLFNKLKCLFFPGLKLENLSKYAAEAYYSLELTVGVNDTATFEKILKSSFGRLLPQKEIETVAEFVKSTLFKKEKLTAQNKQLMLLAASALLIEKVIVSKKIEYLFFQGVNEDEITLLGTLFALSLIRHEMDDVAYVQKTKKMLATFPSLFSQTKLKPDSVERLIEIFFEHKEKIVKKGLFSDKEPYSVSQIWIEDDSNQSLYLLPSEHLSEKNYLKSLEEEHKSKQHRCFTSQYFVQNYFSTSDKTKFLKEGVDQWKKDVLRLQYLFDYKKVQLPDFGKYLKKNWIKLSEKKESSEDVSNLIEEIVQIEKEEENSGLFLKRINKCLEKKPDFLKFVKASYEKLKEEAIEHFLEKWTKKDLEKQEILTLSHQGAAQEVTSYLRQRYAFLPVAKEDPNLELEFQEIALLERKTGGFSNTCFNYVVKDKHKIIEVYQVFEIANRYKQEVYYFITTLTSIDLITGHATIFCTPPSKENPGHVYEIVKKKLFMGLSQ